MKVFRILSCPDSNDGLNLPVQNFSAALWLNRTMVWTNHTPNFIMHLFGSVQHLRLSTICPLHPRRWAGLGDSHLADVSRRILLHPLL